MADRNIDFKSHFEGINLPLYGVRLPSFKIENEYKREIHVSEDISNYDFLRSLANLGFKNLKINKNNPLYNRYVERAKYEIDTLADLGFVDYVLLVWDVINYCKKNDIPTGLGRGSAAGSLILFLIGVTKVDPIEYGLYFERFVSKVRAKKRIVDGVTYLDGSLMCDVDLDICYYNRLNVIKYLEEKFKGKTSKILTFNTLSGKLCIKECGKIVGKKNEQEMNLVSSMIPKVFGKVKDIEEAYNEVDEFKEWCDENKLSYEIALKIKGLIKNKGVHPSALALSYENMMESCPTELTKVSEKSSDKVSVSSYDMNWTSVSNVKLDLLGLRSVSVIDDVCKNVKVEVQDIDLNDSFIYEKLQDLRTPHGLFQIEADTNFKVCRKVKPKTLEELSAVLALARPGALAYVDQYADYANNGIYEPSHPFFDDILKETGGVALYQEQLMKMANKIGFTLDEAELLRRIVGKKKRAEVRKWKKKIKSKVKESGLDPDVGKVLWKILEDSANYSFNKSHSISYAALAATTIYLKFKYPQQFFLSLLRMTRHEPDPINEISKIQKEMSAFDTRLLAPHITKSRMDFTVEGDDIRFGLLSIKGISDKSIEKLNKFKKDTSTKFEVFEAASEAGLTIGILCALIQAGAFQGFIQSRTKIVYEAQLWNVLTKREKKFCMEASAKHDHDLVKALKYVCSQNNERGKPLIKESRLGTIKKKSLPYKEIFELNRFSESFANWYYENHLLGYTYGKTLRDIFIDTLPDLESIRNVNSREQRDTVHFVGTISGKPSTRMSKKGNRYFVADVGDESANVKIMMFGGRIEECQERNANELPKEKNIVVVKGQKQEDNTVFANSITIQTNKIYTRFSEINKKLRI
jgi:DNA polymerase-3 subunit alpha